MASCRYNPKTDTYEIRAYGGIDPVTGKVINHYAKLPGDATDEEIEEAKAKLTDHAKGFKGTEEEPSFEKMLEFRLDALADENYAPGTIASYKSYAKNLIVPFLGHCKGKDIKSSTIQGLYRQLIREGGLEEDPLSPNTVRQLHSFLSTTFKFFVQNDLMEFSPMDGVVKPRAEHYEAVALNEWDFQALNGHLIDMHKKYLVSEDISPVYTAYLLALDTGARRGELAGFQLRDYSRRARSVRVSRTISQARNNKGEINYYKDTKNASSRRPIDLSDDTCEYLEKHIAHQAKLLAACGIKQGAKTPLFANTDATPIKPSFLTDTFNGIVKKLDLDKEVHLHTLRHTHASYLLAEGMDLRTLADRLGHSKESTTLNIYSHFIPGTGRKAATMFTDIRTRIAKGY